MDLRELLSSVVLDDDRLEAMRQELIKTHGKPSHITLKIIHDELYIEDEKGVAPFDLLHWADLIDGEVDQEAIDELGLDKAAEIILDELSFYGMDEGENKLRVAEMRVDTPHS